MFYIILFYYFFHFSFLYTFITDAVFNVLTIFFKDHRTIIFLIDYYDSFCTVLLVCMVIFLVLYTYLLITVVNEESNLLFIDL